MISRLRNPETLVFAAIIIVLALWVGSGMIGRDIDAPAPPDRPIPVVAASESVARPVDRELLLYGEVQPSQVIIVRARTQGLLEDVVPQGTMLDEGDVVGQLSDDDRSARLAQAQAQLASARSSADAARQLAERGIGASLDAEARQAEFESARAQLRAIELEIENATLRAPVAGTVNSLLAESGSYVAAGGDVLEMVRNDPLLAIVQVQQSEILNIRRGMPAQVRFIGGRETEGHVTFIAPLADAATRTFRVEIEIPNPGSATPAGISAEVRLITDTIEAHFISAALVRLDEQGQVGVHRLDDENRIIFQPIRFVTADSAGLWITGLPDTARLVTISQGAIAAGQEVEVRDTPEEYYLPSPGEPSDAEQPAPRNDSDAEPN